MRYTLDSLAHIECILKSKYPTKSIQKITSIFVTDTNEYKQESENYLYFGVLTSGDNTKTQLYFENKKTILISANSQIIELFSKLSFQDNTDSPIVDGSQYCHFRGFEIILS